MGFLIDPTSVKNMTGVHPDLCRVVRDCAANGALPFVFVVTQGLRTMAQQKQAVASGHSQTLQSRHLVGCAVDLAVLTDGKISWGWMPYYTLADQMRAAGIRCGIPLRWGGQWRALMADYTEPAIQESAAYVTAAKADAAPILLDGPHYELPVEFYANATSPSLIPTA